MIRGRRIIINDGNFEKGLRKFKKMMTEYGTIQEVRDRQEFVKPTVKRKIAKGQAKRRWQKQLRDQMLPKKLF